MKRLISAISIVLFLGTPFSLAYAAIGLDAADSAVTTCTSCLTENWSHTSTTTGTNLMGLVYIDTDNATDQLVNSNSVVWGGKNMVRVAQVNNASGLNNWQYIYCVINQGTGAQTITITAISSNGRIIGNAVSYVGVNQSCTPDAVATSSSGTGTSAASSTQVTTVSNNDWTFMGQRNDNAEPSAGSGTTKRSSSSGLGFGFFDSNSPITPAGNTSLAWSTAGAGHFATIMVAYAPVATPVVAYPTMICVSLYCFNQ